MAKREKLEVTVLSAQSFTEDQQANARENIGAAAISATISKIESSDGTVSAIPYTAEDGSIRYDLKVSAAPVISDTEIYGTNGISAKNQGVKWTIGLSADFLSGNALDNLSGNWQNTYNTVTNNSGKWNEVSSKLNTTAFSTVSSQFAIKTEVQEEFEQTSAWAIETFQPKGDYLSASEKYLSANALNDLSGNWNSVYDAVESYSSKWNDTSATLFNNSGKWNSVYNTVDINSANWDKGYNWIFDNSANIINASATLETNSGNWNSVYDTVETNSGNWKNSYTALTSTSATWNNHSALSASKLDKSAFEGWSANADITEYSGVSPISINKHKVSIDLSEYYKNTETSGKDELNTRFEPIEADIDILKENSAHNVVESKNDYIKVYSGTNEFELEFLSGDLATETWVKEQLGDFGGYVPCEGIGTDNHPNVNDPDPKKMYLVPKDDTTEPDRYYNWIVTGDETTGWLCIGDTSIDLTPYVKISDISAVSGNWNTAYSYVTANSADIAEASATAIDVNNTVNTYSANWQESYNALTSTSANWNSVYDDVNANSATWNDTNTTLSNNSGKWEESYEALTSTSADWNTTYSYVTANSANIESVSSTVNANSGKWNEASAFSANSGKFVTSGGEIVETDLAYVLKKTGDNVAWSGIDLSDLGKIYPITSITPDLVSATISAVNDIPTYVLSAKETDPVVYYDVSAKYAKAQSGTYNDKDYYFISGAEIIGNNGISAEYDPTTNSWEVGLENYNDIGFAKYSTNSNTYTTSAVVTGYQEDLNVNPAKIALTNDQILLKKGFYHVDVQTNFVIGTVDNNYYDVMVKSIPNAASITQMIDASYTHTETVDLSFDVRITNDDTPIEISVENYKSGATFAISNLNIHEIVSMPSQIETDSNNYQAGNGISISNDTIEAKLGNGLKFNESNAIEVKLGEGLAFTDDQGIKAITIDPAGEVAEVVEAVENLQEELDTKITDNFPPAMITLADLQVATGTQYAPANGGMLIGYLFTCPITHNIYVNNEKYQTKIGIYTKQWSGTNNKVILGIYEYDPDYNEGGQVGRTVALCDTGIIELQQGYAEYEIKNVGKDTTPIMTPGKFYYATIYLSYLAGDTNGITLFGAPGYNTQVNNLKPGITITNINCIHASLYEGLQGYSPDLNFDQMGFSWQYNSYPPVEGTPSTSQAIAEAHAAGRPYFAIRNVKK